MRSAVLIGCEGSQQDAYQSDHHNMSLCALVAAQLEFHFVSSQAKLSYSLSPPPSSIPHSTTITPSVWQFVLMLCPLSKLRLMQNVLNGKLKGRFYVGWQQKLRDGQGNLRFFFSFFLFIFFLKVQWLATMVSTIQHKGATAWADGCIVLVTHHWKKVNILESVANLNSCQFNKSKVATKSLSSKTHKSLEQTVKTLEK